MISFSKSRMHPKSHVSIVSMKNGMLAITAGTSENGALVPNGPHAGALVPLEKKFQCTECGKAFTRMDKLRIHNRIHTGVMPYGCQYCEKRFYRWDAWKRHEIRHNQEKGEVSCSCHHFTAQC
jgi:uncharacterized Zn-finger protein